MTGDRWPEVERICLAALERGPAARAAFLDEACRGDMDLRLEVDSLLDGQAAGDDLLGVPPAEIAVAAMADGDDLRPAGDESGAPASHARKPLATGTRLGPYEIEALLGAGGMGDVYRAVDMRLGREVAVKALPREVAADPERLRRFELEARAIAALNHPNILAIHDVGVSPAVPAGSTDVSDPADGSPVRYLVTELLEGETLRDRLVRGPLPVAAAIDVARQMATGLAAAHGRHIIHRDLKPSNVFLTRDGPVKLLDFGIAKVMTPGAADEPGRAIAGAAASEASGRAGTVGYMSPEQVMGLPTDARSDIFSFGAVLYEMLTGRRAFIGGTTADTPSTVLAAAAPPLVDACADAPEALRSLVSRCLAKGPADRLHSAEDLARELDALSVAPAAPAGGRRLLRPGVILSLTAAVGIAGAVILAALWDRPQAQPKQDGLTAALLTSYTGVETQPSFSPDGNKLAFVWDGEREDNQDIYVKQIGSSGPPMRLTTSPAAEASPAWSPDDRWIAFTREQPDQGNVAILMSPPLGGPERKLAEMPAVGGLCWTPDGKWLAFSQSDSAHEPMTVWATQVETGERRRLTSAQSPLAPPTLRASGAKDPAFGDVYLSISPDGRALVFTRGGNFVNHLYVLPVTQDLHPAGEPVRVTNQNYGLITGVAWTVDSRDVVFAAGGFGIQSLWRVSAAGTQAPQRLPYALPAAVFPTIALRRPRLAYAWNVHNMNLWRLDTRTGQSRMLIGSTYRSELPQYSPDGRRIAFQSNRSGNFEVWSCDADGSNCLQLTSFGGPQCGTPRWSPDGRWIAFDARVEGWSEVYVIPAEGGTPRRVTTGTASTNGLPSWSPDGRWVYFTSNRSDRLEIWKIPARGGQASQITRSGGKAALSSPDGKYLYYVKEPGPPGLFRMPAGGGEETQVLSRPFYWHSYGVTTKGVYFKTDRSIELLDAATGKVSTVAVFGGPHRQNLCVSPDDRYLVWAQLDRNTSDLMVVENFR